MEQQKSNNSDIISTIDQLQKVLPEWDDRTVCDAFLDTGKTITNSEGKIIKLEESARYSIGGKGVRVTVYKGIDFSVAETYSTQDFVNKYVKTTQDAQKVRDGLSVIVSRLEEVHKL